ncbi:hypothetical protein WMF27_32860 [Sorangium sp. So ce281]|uniref:hypothetical protein n=1 Tax=unclassified Sorangium TaxID=2621164 RepID=UPI003F62088A
MNRFAVAADRSPVPWAWQPTASMGAPASLSRPACHGVVTCWRWFSPVPVLCHLGRHPRQCRPRPRRCYRCRRRTPCQIAAELRKLVPALLDKGRLDRTGGPASCSSSQELLPALHAEALHASGDAEAARAVLREARADLLARSARIGEPVLRKSFLENVSANAHTLALSRAWLDDTSP